MVFYLIHTSLPRRGTYNYNTVLKIYKDLFFAILTSDWNISEDDWDNISVDGWDNISEDGWDNSSEEKTNGQEHSQNSEHNKEVEKPRMWWYPVLLQKKGNILNSIQKTTTKAGICLGMSPWIKRKK